MNPRMSFDVDPARDLVRITLTGFFSPDDVDRFVAARDAAHRQLRCAPNAHVTIVDMRAMQIQAQETVAAFQQVLSDPRMVSRRLAFVVARSLSRLQIKRAAAERAAEYFTSLEEAECWVLRR